MTLRKKILVTIAVLIVMALLLLFAGFYAFSVMVDGCFWGPDCY